MVEQIRPRPPQWPLFVALGLAGFVGLALASAFYMGFQRSYANGLYHARRTRGDFDYAHGDYADAADEYGQMVALRPDAARGYAKRSDCYYELGRYTAAIADDTQAIRLAQGPSYLSDLHYNRGNAYDARQDYPAAIADYTEALRLNPSNTDALRSRIGAYQDARDYPRALQDADALIAPHPMAAQGYLYRAYVWRAKGDHARAAADYRTAMRLAPDDKAAYDALAQMWDGDGRDAEAAQVARAETQAHPDDGACWGSLGWWQYKAGDLGDSIASSRRAAGLDGQLAFVRLNLGLCYAVQGNWQMAEQTYANVLPHCSKEDVQAGINDLTAALKTHPNQKAILKSLALLRSPS